jgi:hypothetical protein
MITATAVDQHVQQLFDVLERLHSAFTGAKIEYRIIGGLAIFLQISERSHDAARLTRDVDVAVDRKDLKRITNAVESFGFRYRHVAGVDMLVDAKEPSARSAVHLIFVGEKVRREYLEPVPDFTQPTVTKEGILLASVLDLARMKLTSFRLKDKVHIVDLDSVGLITPEIEQALPQALRVRLDQVRQEERQSTGAE